MIKAVPIIYYIIELVFLRFLRSPLKRKHGKIWIKI